MSDPINDKILDALKARKDLASPSGFSSTPRTATPEPLTSSGHRGSIQLLDDEGLICEQLYNALAHIFAKYCSPPSPPESKRPTPQGSLFPPPPPTSYLSDAGLDSFASDTNGSHFDADTKGEIKEFFDLDEESGGLTLKGFEQMYQLQTEADEEETWKDLAAHGFDRSLRLVSSRREDEIEEAAPVAMTELSGLGMGGTKRDEEDQEMSDPAFFSFRRIWTQAP